MMAVRSVLLFVAAFAVLAVGFANGLAAPEHASDASLQPMAAPVTQSGRLPHALAEIRAASQTQLQVQAKVDPAFGAWVALICNNAGGVFWHQTCAAAGVPANGGLYEWATGSNVAPNAASYVGRALSTDPLRTRCTGYNPANAARIADVGSHQSANFQAYLNGGVNRCMWYRWAALTDANVPKYQGPTPPGTRSRPGVPPPLVNRRAPNGGQHLDDYIGCREVYHFQRKNGVNYVYPWNAARGGTACSDAVDQTQQNLATIQAP